MRSFRGSFNCRSVAITCTNGTRLQIWILHIYLRPRATFYTDRILGKSVPINFVYCGFTITPICLFKASSHTSTEWSIGLQWQTLSSLNVWLRPGSSHRINVCMQLAFLSNIGAEEDWEQCVFRRSMARYVGKCHFRTSELRFPMSHILPRFSNMSILKFSSHAS